MYERIPKNEMEFKIVIWPSDKGWIDVSKKKAVVYGAGQGCFDLMDEMQLPNVHMIVDSDKGKWGGKIQLLNKVYNIQSPSILSSLNVDEYYFVISSSKNEKEIKKTIHENIKSKNILICDREEIFYCYNRIEDMLYFDPLIKRKIIKLNFSFDIEKIISLFEKIISCLKYGSIDYFLPAKKGDSKLIFFFGTENDLLVCSIPGVHNEFEEMAINRDKKCNKEIRCELKKRLSLDNQITIFENAEVLIQKYAGEYIDFISDEVKKRVLEKCRILHQIDEKINIENDMISRYSSDLVDKVVRGGTSSLKEVRDLEESMKKPLNMLKKIVYIPALCHCDLFCSNIVCLNNKLYFIDWEYMAMGDPMFDVCGYLFSVGMMLYSKRGMFYEEALTNVYTLLKKDLFSYFNRSCTKEEYKHAFLVMLVFEYRNVLSECLYGGSIDKKKKNILMNRIHSFY